jgi:Flp pilus assembly protein TadD
MTDHDALTRGRSLLELRRWAEAEKVMRSVLATDPGCVEALLLLSAARIEQGDPTTATLAARRAVRLAPEDPNAHIALSSAACELDDAWHAQTAAQQAVRLAPHDWTAHHTLGRALLVGPEPHANWALVSANEAVRLAPYASEAHNLAGICLSELKLNSEAHRAYGEALRLDPDNVYAMNNLGALSLDGGRLADASRLFRSALGNDPNMQILRQNLDLVLIRLMLMLCGVLLGAFILDGYLLLGGASRAVRAPIAGAALLIAAAMAFRILRQLPRGSLAWAFKLGKRVSSESVVIIVGVPLLLVLLAAVSLGGTPVGDAARDGLNVVLKILTWMGIATSVGLIRSNNKKN